MFGLVTLDTWKPSTVFFLNIVPKGKNVTIPRCLFDLELAVLDHNNNFDGPQAT